MAAKEMWDYLAFTLTPDNDVTLSTPKPQKILVERGARKQHIHEGDNGKEEIIQCGGPQFTVTLKWPNTTEGNAGAVLAFYTDYQKGDGREKSFKWAHPTDGHTYVVRFDCDLKHEIKAYGTYGIPELKLRILGKAA